MNRYTKSGLIAASSILLGVFFYYWLFIKLGLPSGREIIADFRKKPADIKEPAEQHRYAPNKRQAAARRSSIVIDLNRDGITTSPEGNNIYFDLNSNGFAESTGWINDQDGLLVADLNNNDKIDNGRELFGNHTLLRDGALAANGFEALKEWDSNGDSIISELDEGWSQLKIWRDKNPYGKTDDGELLSLDEIGLKSIDLNYKEQNITDSSDNKHTQTGKVEWKDGGNSSAVEVWFKVDPTDSIDLENVSVSAEPNIKAFGNVADLRTSMQKNKALRQKVKTFLSSDFSRQRKLLNDLIYEWTGSMDVDPYSRDPSQVYGHVMDARQLVALENLVGQPYINIHDWDIERSNPRPDAAAILIDEYHRFANYAHAALLAKNNYRREFEDIILHQFDAQGKLFYDDARLVKTLKTLIEKKNFDKAKVLVFIAQNLGNYDSLLKKRIEKVFIELSHSGNLYKNTIASLEKDIEDSEESTETTPAASRVENKLPNSQTLRW